MCNPWIKFYPSDWRADPALRMCSLGARGLWMEMLCIMHEADGFLTVNGKELLPRQLAALAGTSLDDVTSWMVELSDAGVFSRDERGFIYSRRMLKDLARAAADKANGKKGGNPTLKGGVNPPDNPPVGEGDKAQKPEARSQIQKEDNTPESSSNSHAPRGEVVQLHRKENRKAAKAPPAYTGDYEIFWAEYPRQKNTSKAEAFAVFIRLSPEDQNAAIEGAIAYAEHCRKEQTPERFIAHATTFLNQRRWECAA